MLNWEDLRFVLAIGRYRTLSEAARRLGLNHSTVHRRLRRIESALGTQLFEKHSDGYVATPAGEMTMNVAEHIEDSLVDLGGQLEGHAGHLSGNLRITTTDTLWFSVLPSAINSFCQAHPGIDIEVVISNEFVNLNKRHADVAVRPAAAPSPSLFGRKVCDLAFSVYGLANNIETTTKSTTLGAQRWLVPDDSLSYTATEAWLKKKVPEVDKIVRVNSVLGMCDGARAGLGLAALPTYLGNACPELSRIDGLADELSSELWLLTHRDLKNVARVRAFISHIGDYLKKQQYVFR